MFLLSIDQRKTYFTSFHWKYPSLFNIPQKNYIIVSAKQSSLLGAVVTCSVYVSVVSRGNATLLQAVGLILYHHTCALKIKTIKNSTPSKFCHTPKTCMPRDYQMPYSLTVFIVWNHHMPGILFMTWPEVLKSKADMFLAFF